MHGCRTRREVSCGAPSAPLNRSSPVPPQRRILEINLTRGQKGGGGGKKRHWIAAAPIGPLALIGWAEDDSIACWGVPIPPAYHGRCVRCCLLFRTVLRPAAAVAARRVPSRSCPHMFPFLSSLWEGNERELQWRWLILPSRATGRPQELIPNWGSIHGRNSLQPPPARTSNCRAFSRG